MNDLDELDRRILDVIQQDCSLTNQDLAATVHASAPTTLRRVKRLRDKGFIEKQVAILDPVRVGPSLTAIVEITLDSQAAEVMQAFETRMVDEDAVLQCYRVSPGPDFVLVVHLPHMPAYHALVHRAFTAQARVRNVRSFFTTHRAKFETRIAV